MEGPKVTPNQLATAVRKMLDGYPPDHVAVAWRLAWRDLVERRTVEGDDWEGWLADRLVEDIRTLNLWFGNDPETWRRVLGLRLALVQLVARVESRYPGREAAKLLGDLHGMVENRPVSPDNQPVPCPRCGRSDRTSRLGYVVRVDAIVTLRPYWPVSPDAAMPWRLSPDPSERTRELECPRGHRVTLRLEDVHWAVSKVTR